MDKDKALRMALEALEEPKEHIAKHRKLEAINAIKEALAQPEPQWTPVEIGVDVTNEGAHVVGTYVLPDVVRYVFYSKLHPAPQREWVGLTEEEYQDIRYGSDDESGPYVDYTIYEEGDGYEEIEIYVDDFAKAIEAKLKEKNGC